MTADTPTIETSQDLVTLLLTEQQQLTAVERFSRTHEASHAGPAQERYYRNLIPLSAPASGEQYAFEVDLDACSGCKACVVACHTLNGLGEEETWRKVGALAGDPGTDAALLHHVTTACHHCVEPGCLKGCPVQAYEKDASSGIVRHLDDQCIGCKYCTMMCPYEVPQYNDALGIVRKCDMCRQRLSVGEAPACVQACPNEAIRVSIVSTAGAREAADEPEGRLVPQAPRSALTVPTTQYRSQRALGRSVPQDREVDRPAESHWPLAVMLVLTQASVGVLLVERLGAALAAWSGAIPLPAMTQAALLVAIALALAGLNVAPLHLGQPLKAWRVFLGLRTSWLSREAIAFGGYAAALSTAGALAWLPSAGAWWPAKITGLAPVWALHASAWIALLLGLVGAYCSGMVYIATRRELWRFSRTMQRFGLTMLVCGGAVMAAVMMRHDVEFPLVIGNLIAALGGLGFKLQDEWRTHTSGVARARPDAPPAVRLEARSRRLVRQHLWVLLRSRFALGVTALVAGIAGLGLFVAEMPNAAAVITAMAAILSIAGELAERLLYFRSVVHDRMPGIVS